MSDIMSMQHLAGEPKVNRDVKAEKDLQEGVVMHRQVDSLLEKYINGGSSDNAGAGSVSDDISRIDGLISDVLSKDLSEFHDDTVGGVLAKLVESIQKLLKESQKSGEAALNPKIELSSGFTIDLVSGEMRFDIESLLKIINSNSGNEFIEHLKSVNRDQTIPDFKDFVAESVKIQSMLKKKYSK